MVTSLTNDFGELLSPPVGVDHNDATPQLDTRGALSDLARFGIELRDGLTLLVYDEDAEDGRIDDLIGTGVARFDRQRDRWVADIDWSSLPAYVHFSDPMSARPVQRGDHGAARSIAREVPFPRHEADNRHSTLSGGCGFSPQRWVPTRHDVVCGQGPSATKGATR